MKLVCELNLYQIEVKEIVSTLVKAYVWMIGLTVKGMIRLKFFGRIVPMENQIELKG